MPDCRDGTIASRSGSSHSSRGTTTVMPDRQRHSTVKHHLANARTKVGAATTAQLVWILAPQLGEPTGKYRVTRTA